MAMTLRSHHGASASMPSQGRRQAGYTLLELVIVVAIISILSALAYNSYQDSAIKSRRKAATACMMESAQFLERNYTTTLAYNVNSAGVAITMPPSNCRTDLGNFYDWPDPIATATARTYSIQAVPKGIQLSKDKCGTLTIDQSGTKTRSGTLPVAECFP